MYPPLFVSDIKENEKDKIFFDKKLCKELCRVFSCLSSVCILYLIFFLKIIDDELNMNITLI